MKRRMPALGAADEAVAPLRSAARLDTERGCLQQSQGEVVESTGIAALQLKSNLADCFGRGASDHPDFAFVDRRLDPRPGFRLDLEGCTAQIDEKERVQIAGDAIRQVCAARGCPRVGAVVGDCVLPPGAQRHAGSNGLDEPSAPLADAKGQSAPLQRQIPCVMVGGDQPLRHAYRACGHFNERALQCRKIGCPSRQL